MRLGMMPPAILKLSSGSRRKKLSMAILPSRSYSQSRSSISASSSGVNFGAMVTESRAFLKVSPHPMEHIDCGNDTDRDAGRPKHVLDHVPGLARPGLRHAGYIEG